MRVLAVDDDANIRGWVRMVLTEAGFHVDVADSAATGRNLGLSVVYDLAIVDLDLPDRSGLGVVYALREAGRTHPIIIMTGNDDEDAIVSGLDAGADDYLVKPVSNGVLRARVRAALRRGGAAVAPSIQVGNVRLEPSANRAFVGRAELPLTAREYDLITFLLQRPDDVIGRADLLERVWNMRSDTVTNVIDATVSRLRQKLRAAGADVEINAVRGRGYSLATRGARHHADEPR